MLDGHILEYYQDKKWVSLSYMIKTKQTTHQTGPLLYDNYKLRENFETFKYLPQNIGKGIKSRQILEGSWHLE